MTREETVDDVAERPLGWLRVWAFAFAGMAVPFWLLATAVYIQLSPSLNGTEAGVTMSEVPTALWVWAAYDMACTLTWILPFALILLVGGRFAQLALQRQADAHRERLADEVQSDAVIDDESWRA